MGDRLVPEAHDLVLSKCAAGRERDWEFAEEAIRHGLADPDELLRRLDDMPVAPDGLDRYVARWRASLHAPKSAGPNIREER